MRSLTSCISQSVLKGPVQVLSPAIDQITNLPSRTLWGFHLPLEILMTILTIRHDENNRSLLLSVHLAHPLLIKLHHHRVAPKGLPNLQFLPETDPGVNTMFPNNQTTCTVMTNTQ